MDTTDQFVLDDGEDSYVMVEEPAAAAAALDGGGCSGGGDPADPDTETDAARLAQRTKQVALGKNTPAYRNYIKLVPK